MMSYGQLFLTVLPVVMLIGLGVVLSRVEWVKAETEEGLFNLVVKVLTPCLIFVAVAGNAVLRERGNLLLAPLAGFGLTLLGIALAYGIGRALGLQIGTGLRT